MYFAGLVLLNPPSNPLRQVLHQEAEGVVQLGVGKWGVGPLYHLSRLWRSVPLSCRLRSQGDCAARETEQMVIEYIYIEYSMQGHSVQWSLSPWLTLHLDQT